MTNHPAVRPVVTARALEALKAELTHHQYTMDNRAGTGEVSASYHAGYTARYYETIELLDQLLIRSRERAERVAGKLGYSVVEDVATDDR